MTTTSGRAVGFVDRLADRARLGAHHHVVRGLEDRLRAASHDLVIVDEQHRNGGVVPGMASNVPMV
jgi:hypothetical protein